MCFVHCNPGLRHVVILLSIMIDVHWIHGRKEHRMYPFLDVFATWNQSRLNDRVRIVESNYRGRLSHVSSQSAMIPSSRSVLSRVKRLPLYTWNTSDYSKTSLEINLAHHTVNEDQFHRLQGRGLFSQEMTNKVEKQFQCRHLQEGSRL